MLLSLGVLLLLTVLAIPSMVPHVNAATGLVCIADSSLNPASCPASPASVSAPVGSNVNVAINVQGSDTLNGFDISVQVDPSVLQPLNITLTNSVIHDPRLIAAESANPTTGIARLAMVAAGYSVTGPVTGNLFNIVYKVLVSGRGTDITFEAGCTGTSVPNTCVTIVSPSVIPEAIQTATFAGGPITPNFTISANPSFQTVQQGFSATSTIVVASLNGFAGVVNFTIPFSCLAIGCPQWSINPVSVALVSGGTAQATLTFSTDLNTPTMTFSGTVTGTSGSLSHSVVVSFQVLPPPPPPDFSILANPSSQTVQQGSSATSSIMLSSLGGFSGTVNLATSPPPLCPSCPNWTISPTSVMLMPGATAQATLTFSTTAGSPTMTFNVNVIGTSGSLSHSVGVSFAVVPPPPPSPAGLVCIAPSSSFSCPTLPPMFTGTVGGQLSVAVNVQNSSALNGFDIQVLTDPSILQPISDSLTGTVLQNVLVVANSVNSTTGLVRVAAVASGFITTAPTTGRFFSITYNIVGATPGTFILFPVRCPGSSDDSVCVTVTDPAVVPENVLEANFTSTAPPPPDFTIKASPTSLNIPKGQSASSTITLSSLNGFSGGITLSATITPSLKKGPGVMLTPTSLSLVPGGTATASLMLSTNGASATGTYTVTITATSGMLTRTVTVTVTILPRH